MTAVLELLGKTITYGSAAEDESDILRKSTFVPKSRTFYTYLSQHASHIQALVSHHLGLTTADGCFVTDRTEWIRGTFNVCVPVVICRNGKNNRVLMRFPMPHALAESTYPGTIDEKISCEVATYAWIEDNCPDIPIPHLLGFSFSDGRTFTHATHRRLHVRLTRAARRFICTLLRRPVPSRYTPHASRHCFDTGYILLEYIEPVHGTVLANSWKLHLNDRLRRRNLFRGLSRIILSLARMPQPRIGSFRFYDDGTVSLTNRPLTCSLAILENFGAPRIMEPHTTYSTVEPYVSDLLTYHDNRFLHQPNAVNDASDCQYQMTVMAVLRAVSHRYFCRDLRNGPFVLYFTDLHQSNLFVDDDWNITKLIDLEWICSLPIEMEGPPYWLTNLGVDQIHGKALDAFNTVREEFMDILEEEEAQVQQNLPDALRLSRLWQNGWNKGMFWYCLCLTSVNGMYTLFHHVSNRFSTPDTTTAVRQAISPFWAQDSSAIMKKKLKDKADYDADLQRIFAELKS